MKLYFSPGACSLSPHIALREAGLTFEAVKTDLKTKTVKSEGDFYKVNPLGYVPALELDDGTVITEGPAIVQWVADQAPKSGLAPAAGTPERTKLQSWLNFLSTELHKGYSPLFNPKLSDDVKAVFKEKLATRIGHLDKHLASQPYLMGAAFTAADAYAFTVLNWSRNTGVDLSPFPNVQKYHGRIAERPAVMAAMKAEGLTK